MPWLLALFAALCFYLDDINVPWITQPQAYFEVEKAALKSSTTWWNEDGTEGETSFLIMGDGILPTQIVTKEQLIALGQFEFEALRRKGDEGYSQQR
ncbi:MAG TPA: hypothetical protein VF790_11715 [Dissulfurispiraceae bacterium]